MGDEEEWKIRERVTCETPVHARRHIAGGALSGPNPVSNALAPGPISPPTLDILLIMGDIAEVASPVPHADADADAKLMTWKRPSL